MYSLGIDLGSSSVKVSVLDIATGKCVANATNPKDEMLIRSVRPGWAEQDPRLWWRNICAGIAQVGEKIDLKAVRSVGVAYQMHGLVCLGKDGEPLRDAIIWCDSRAVEIGAGAFEALGKEWCLEHLLGSPGNFTACKLAWVKRNEPELYASIWKAMLPGDYVAYKLTGEAHTTSLGLSEGTLWDFAESRLSSELADHFGFDAGIFPSLAPSLGVSSAVSAAAASITGLPEGIPVSYRAGDQPNNAFSLGVLNPGEVAATAGTSGVVYGVTDVAKADPLSRVNSFPHVGDSPSARRLGVLLCINGTGILYSWLRHNVASTMSYAQMDAATETVPAGSDGLLMYPFGNGAERVLCNSAPGAAVSGLDFNRHTTAHMLRAALEGIAFSFCYGMEVMKDMGLEASVIRAGRANLFQSAAFRSTLSALSGATIELYDTDGALGAARGAALGAGIYADAAQAFAGLSCLETCSPDKASAGAVRNTYEKWKNNLKF